MKKILLVLLSFVFVTCLFAGCGGSGGGGSVRFDDLSETVEYGDVYILAKTVEANGSTYEAEAVVKDSKGQEVAVFGGRFDVFDIDGYTIYYSAYDGDKSVGKWKVTLKVNMAVKPTVEIDEDFSTVNSYEIGEEFLLPVVRYYSAISENLNKTDNLYKVASGSEIAVAFADGKFTPEADGNYVYRVKVTDEFGNENLIEYAFSIRNLPAEQEVEAFDHFGSANNVSTKTGAMGFEATDYCYKEIGGKTGSIKLTVKAQWPQFYVRSRRELNAAEYPWIAFDIYVDGADLPEGTRKCVGVTDANNGLGINRLTTCNEWVTIYTSTENYLSKIDESGFGLLFSINNDGWKDGGKFRTQDDFVCYVSDIRAVKKHEVSSSDQIIDFGKDDALMNIHSMYNVKWDFGFDTDLVSGETVDGNDGSMLKLVASNEQCAYPKLLVKPAKTAAEYKAAGVTNINIPIYVSAKGLPEERKSKKFSFWKAGGGADDKYLSVGEWTVVSRTIDDLFSNEPDVNGDNTGDGYIIIFQMDNSADNDLNYEIYVGNIAGGNNLFPTIKNYTQKCRAEGTYVDNNTLLKVTIYEGDVNNSIKCYCYPGITKADMAGITSVKFRVYIDSSALSEKSKAKGYKEVCFLPHSEGKEVSVTNVEFDKWVEIEVSTEDLWKYYDTTYKVLPLLTAYNKDDEDKGYVYDENLVVYFDGFYAV